MPKDKAELLARIDQEWTALRELIDSLTPKQMTEAVPGSWSVKDHLVHLTTWEQFLLRYHLGQEPPHIVMGVEEETFEGLDEDGMNALIYERSQNRPLEDVLDSFGQSHTLVLDALGPMTFADLMQPRYADDPEARPLINWVIGNTYDHYREHRQTIQSLPIP
jgi:hypothetical protein